MTLVCDYRENTERMLGDVKRKAGVRSLGDDAARVVKKNIAFKSYIVNCQIVNNFGASHVVKKKHSIRTNRHFLYLKLP